MLKVPARTRQISSTD